MDNFFRRALISAVGVVVGSSLSDGIHYDDWMSLLWAVLLLSFFTAVLRPLLILVALPFVVLTLGFGLLVINAFLYLWVGDLLNGFAVDGFGSAFFGAFVITVLNLIFARWIGNSDLPGRAGGTVKRDKTTQVKAKDDVIDI
tara:strand:- start:85 stop:510 length:426 start_codon:yes stop_codon:yes gene_type:complete